MLYDVLLFFSLAADLTCILFIAFLLAPLLRCYYFVDICLSSDASADLYNFWNYEAVALFGVGAICPP